MVGILWSPGVERVGLPVSLVDWLGLPLRLRFALGALSFRQFEAADVEALYAIRNHDSVRAFMPTAQPLDHARHVEWVRTNLLTRHARSPLVFVGRDGDAPAAMCVIKPTERPGGLELGVLVTGPWQRTQVVPRMAVVLYTIAVEVLGAGEVVTYVNARHEQALRFNRGWGMQETASDKPDELRFQSPVAPLKTSALYRRLAPGLSVSIDAA